MKGNLTTFIVLFAIILTACGGQAPAATATPTVAATQVLAATSALATEAPLATDTPITVTDATATATSQLSATPEPPRPTNVPGCTNTAGFVADITIPDNTQIDGGAEFVKTWRIVNKGTCIWASDYKLAYYSEERMNAPATVPLAITYPGQTVDISVTLTAPNTAGSHRANFVLENPESQAMKISDDSRLWLIIQVGNVAAATAANTATAAVSAATNVSAPSATVAAGGSGGLVTVTCAYSIDQSKLLDVIKAVNAYRAQSGGMSAYPVNPKLAQAAQAQANDMACNNLFGHTGSNGSTIQSRVTATGYTFSYVSENVYGSYPPLSGQDVVNWWKNDKTDLHHNLNLISDTFTEFGVGYAFYNNYGYYVIVFAAPK
ncbi:MAG: CAP domain-containing protein [Chloroflexota bacterium]